MRLLVILFCSTLLMSCGASYKLKKFKEYAYKNENSKVVAETCNILFPCKVTETEIKEVITERVDTIKGDSIPCPEATLNDPRPYVKCPDVKCTSTHTHTHEVQKVEDTRRLEILQRDFDEFKKNSEEKYNTLLKDYENVLNQLKTCKIEKETIKKKANKRGWIIYGTLGVLALIGFLKLRSKTSIF